MDPPSLSEAHCPSAPTPEVQVDLAHSIVPTSQHSPLTCLVLTFINDQIEALILELKVQYIHF